MGETAYAEGHGPCPRERRLFMFMGQVGLPARALVFALIGYFLLRAAIDFDPRNAVGTDGALSRASKPRSRRANRASSTPTASTASAPSQGGASASGARAPCRATRRGAT